MGAPLADPNRIASWVGLEPFAAESTDLARATEVVGTISDFARHEARQPDWTLEDAPAAVSGIVLMVAVECWSNPDNKTSVTIDDVTRRWEAGDLFSKSQLDTLRSHRANKPSGLGTVQFSRGFDAPSIAIRPGLPSVPRPSGSAVSNDVVGGSPVILYDGRGY